MSAPLKDSHPPTVEAMLEEAGWRLDPRMYLDDAWYYNLCNLAVRWRERALTAEAEAARLTTNEEYFEAEARNLTDRAEAAEAEVARLRTALEALLWEIDHNSEEAFIASRPVSSARAALAAETAQEGTQ